MNDTGGRELVEILDDLIALLYGVGEKHWSAWLRTDGDLIRNRKFRGVERLLSAYGGMGSLNDLIICPENGHKVDPVDVDATNRRFQALKGEAYRVARALQREIDASR